MLPFPGDAMVGEIGPGMAAGGLELDVYAYPQHADGHFLPFHRRSFALDDMPDWNSDEICSGPLCPITGTILITNLDTQWLLPPQGANIAIATFD